MVPVNKGPAIGDAENPICGSEQSDPGRALVAVAVAGSGDKQASAKLCCVEIDEVAVAFGPPA